MSTKNERFSGPGPDQIYDDFLKKGVFSFESFVLIAVVLTLNGQRSAEKVKFIQQQPFDVSPNAAVITMYVTSY